MLGDAYVIGDSEGGYEMSMWCTKTCAMNVVCGGNYCA